MVLKDDNAPNPRSMEEIIVDQLAVYAKRSQDGLAVNWIFHVAESQEKRLEFFDRYLSMKSYYDQKKARDEERRR